MKKVVTLRNRLSLSRFTLVDVIFLVIIFSLLSVTITIFVFKKYIRINNTNDIDKVYNQIINDYYEDVDKDELSKSAIDGMMKFLGEKYSIYMDTDSTNRLTEELDGKYHGVGVVVQYKDNKLVIVDLLKDSPAEKGGLQKGDQIIQLNDYVVTEDTNATVNYIKEHDEIAFLVRRNESDVIINIKTSDIDNPVTSSKIISKDDNNYGYIYLGSFTSAAYKQFKSELVSLEKENIKGLIIDLRDNRGGYLDQAELISSMFVQKGKTLFYLKDKNESKAWIDGTDEKRDYPIVVITNGNTASSSEVLAMSLKENNGALIVGTKSLGKGKVQETTSVSNDSMVKFTTAKWYSPNNNNIDGVGINPNYIVELSKKYYQYPIDKNDNQLNKAIEVLSK